jgi:hypothetical protein
MKLEINQGYTYHIFTHYPINGTIYEEALLIIKCVFIFYTNFAWNISYFNNNWARSDKNLHWSLCKVSIFFVRF